ncbi:uncharacterized protein METZ01_LOCUS185835, partial [marine metagenome]
MSISSFVIDTTAPTVTQETAVTTPTNDTTPNYTFSTNEAGTITYGGSCSSSTTSAISGNNPITLNSLIEGTYSNCTITVTDSLGHASSALSVSTFVVDTTAPSVSSFTLSDTELKAGDNATVRLVFSEVVASFSSDDDITVDTGTLASMTSSNNITWTGTFTPTADEEDAGNKLSLATSYTDTAGNAGTAATTLNYEVDTLAPSVISFTLSPTALKAGDNATVTLVFSEAVASFSSAADITVAGTAGAADNGSLATMTSINNITWTGTFTPTANTEEASNTLSLAASWTDTVGNAGTDNTTSNYEIETQRPDASFTFSVVQGTTFTNADNSTTYPALKTGDNATVTLVFSEEVFSFSAADIGKPNNHSLSNVNFAEMTSSDNITWAGTFTPNDNIADLTNKLRLKSNSFTDIAGNYGTRPYAKWSFDNTTENFVVDTGGAAVTSFSPSNNKVCIPVSENITVTFDFPMFTTSITSDTSTGCGASIMVSSSDDSGVFFSTPNCVPFPGNPVASDSNKTFTLDPVNNLAYNTTYKIKVTTEGNDIAKSELMNNLSNQYESSFTTSPSPS